MSSQQGCISLIRSNCARSKRLGILSEFQAARTCTPYWFDKGFTHHLTLCVCMLRARLIFQIELIIHVINFIVWELCVPVYLCARGSKLRRSPRSPSVPPGPQGFTGLCRLNNRLARYLWWPHAARAKGSGQGCGPRA